jgi:hypothetical protein
MPSWMRLPDRSELIIGEVAPLLELKEAPEDLERLRTIRGLSA